MTDAQGLHDIFFYDRGDARRQLPSLRSVVDEARAGVRQGDVRDVQRSFMTNFL